MGNHKDYISETTNQGTLSGERFEATASECQVAVWEMLFECQNICSVSATDFVMARFSDRRSLWAEQERPASKVVAAFSQFV